MSLIHSLSGLYSGFFGGLQRLTEGWFLGLTARLVFASVLLGYFLNAAYGKVGSGFPGMLIPGDNTYVQILGAEFMDKFGYVATNVPIFPYKIIVFAGTYAEFVLPVLIVAGLFTRAMSLGLIIFVAVQTYVDITIHKADATTIGHFFDRIHNSEISDLRLLWLFPLVYLILRGPGMVSLDYIFGLFSKKS